MREDGEVLPEPCPNDRHGWYFGHQTHRLLEHDPHCQTCSVRAMLSEHDHLHLGRGEPCTTLGLNDVPGVNVRCKCMAFHH